MLERSNVINSWLAGLDVPGPEHLPRRSIRRQSFLASPNQIFFATNNDGHDLSECYDASICSGYLVMATWNAGFLTVCRLFQTRGHPVCGLPVHGACARCASSAWVAVTPAPSRRVPAYVPCDIVLAIGDNITGDGKHPPAPINLDAFDDVDSRHNFSPASRILADRKWPKWQKTKSGQKPAFLHWITGDVVLPTFRFGVPFFVGNRFSHTPKRGGSSKPPVSREEPRESGGGNHWICS